MSERIFGTFNREEIINEYRGLSTESITTTIDNKKRTIQADLKNNIEGGTFNKVQVNKFGLITFGTNEKLNIADLNWSEIQGATDDRYIRLQSEAAQKVTSTLKIEGDIEVTGHIVAYNQPWYDDPINFKTSKNLILLRNESKLGLTGGEVAGIAAYNYSGNGDTGYLVFDRSGVARVGGENNLKPLAARDEANLMTNNHFTYWDESSWLLKTRWITPTDLNKGLLAKDKDYYPEQPKDFTTKDYIDAEVYGSGHYRLMNNEEFNNLDTPYLGLRIFIREDAISV